MRPNVRSPGVPRLAAICGVALAAVTFGFAAQKRGIPEGILPPKGELRPPTDKTLHTVKVRLLATGAGPTTQANLKLPTWLKLDSNGKTLSGDGILIHTFYDRASKETAQKVAAWGTLRQTHPHQNGVISYKSWTGHADISRQLGRMMLMTQMDSPGGTLTYSATWESRNPLGRAKAVDALVSILQSLPSK